MAETHSLDQVLDTGYENYNENQNEKLKVLSSLKPPFGNNPTYRNENKPTCKEGYYKQGRTKVQLNKYF